MLKLSLIGEAWRTQTKENESLNMSFNFLCLCPLGLAAKQNFNIAKVVHWTKPENNSILRKKNTKEIIIKHKGTRMVKDGED